MSYGLFEASKRGIYVPLSKMRSTISPCTKEEGDAADLRLVMMAWYSGALCMEPSTSWVAGVEEWPGAAGGTGAGMVGVEWVDGWLGKWAVTRRWKKGWEKKGRTIDERNSLCHIHGNDD